MAWLQLLRWGLSFPFPFPIKSITAFDCLIIKFWYFLEIFEILVLVGIQQMSICFGLCVIDLNLVFILVFLQMEQLEFLCLQYQ